MLTQLPTPMSLWTFRECLEGLGLALLGGRPTLQGLSPRSLSPWRPSIFGQAENYRPWEFCRAEINQNVPVHLHLTLTYLYTVIILSKLPHHIFDKIQTLTLLGLWVLWRPRPLGVNLSCWLQLRPLGPRRESVQSITVKKKKVILGGGLLLSDIWLNFVSLSPFGTQLALYFPYCTANSGRRGEGEGVGGEVLFLLGSCHYWHYLTILSPYIEFNSCMSQYH